MPSLPRAPRRVKGVEIVGFDEGLLDGAAALRALEWGGTEEANRDYLVWKYLRNPYLTTPSLVFALHAGEVVGMRGSMGTCWVHAGERAILPHGSDLIVAGRYRRHGLARQLVRASDEDLVAGGFRWSMSLSANVLGARSSVSSGAVEVGSLPVVECGGTPAAARRRRLAERARRRLEQQRGGGALTRAWDRARLHERRDPFARLDAARMPGVDIVAREPPGHLAAIAERAGPDDRLRHVRDADYFRWRLANPLSEYRVLSTTDVYVVLQRRASGSSVALVDWRVADPDAFTVLLGDVARRVGIVRLWIEALDDRTRRIVAGVGHLEPVIEQTATFVLRRIGSGPPEPDVLGLPPLNLPSWELRMLDSDIA